MIAETAHLLCTPYPMLRREPINRLRRMHKEAARIAKARRL